ncbi:hypothetical protein Nepgr_015465 [Nepenthes gracilis]|uniref:Uncharacterized protein n=1 Tax=Nepenthes gracilis TaxID=150966 RepID=A0AAD3SMV3_NEPGR|nr:hypothetical protein Nepgr_015465 [Nepenthes gracilis]
MRIGVAEFVVASEQSPSLQFLEANGGGHFGQGHRDKVEVDFLPRREWARGEDILLGRYPLLLPPIWS